MDRLHALSRLAQKAGPYLLLEMVLPGGTLVALLLYLHQNGHLRFLGGARRFAGARRFGARVLDLGCRLTRERGVAMAPG